MVCWFGKKALTNVAISLAKDNLTGLVSNLTSSAINKFDRKVSRKGAVRAEKDLLYLFQMKIWMILLKWWNQYKVQVYQLMELLETVTGEIKKNKKVDFL